MVSKRSRIFKLANIYQILTDVQRILLITVIDMRTRNLDELDMRKIIPTCALLLPLNLLLFTSVRSTYTYNRLNDGLELKACANVLGSDFIKLNIPVSMRLLLCDCHMKPPDRFS
ncbi:hypothetical protein Peur_040366 [Populus x canadensis]